MKSSSKPRRLDVIRSLRNEYKTLCQKMPDSIDQFPLLKELVVSCGKSSPLSKHTVLMIQHQCTNHYALALALIELGILPENMYWIDIPYSSHLQVRKRLLKLGIPAENFCSSSDYRVLRPFAPYMRARVEEKVSALLGNPPEHLIVLDDGSYFLEALSGFKKQFPDVVVVEQTTRGLIKIEQNATLKELSNRIRVINVARSRPKKHLEPPFIGLSLCTSLSEKLGLYFKGGIGGNCLVLGYGVIGEQVAAFLSTCMDLEKRNIHVYDTDKNKIARARKAGFSIWDRMEFNTKFKLVIGCSGRSSFSVGDRVYLEKDAVLASGSSGSVELSREEFIELADTSPIDDIWIDRTKLKENDVHSDIVINFAGHRATFLNSGFPINFDGRITTIPWRHIQATPTMMVAGALQGIRTKRVGIIELSPIICSWIDKRFRELIGAESTVLDLPPLNVSPLY